VKIGLWKARATIARKMYLGFSSVLVLMLVIGGISYAEIKSIGDTYENLLDNRVESINMIDKLILLSKEVQLANRGYLLIGNEESLAAYQETKLKFEELRGGLGTRLETETEIKLAQELDNYHNQYLRLAEETIALKKGNNPSYVDVISKKGPPLVSGFREKAEEMIKYETDALTQERGKTKAKLEKIQRDIIIFSLLALVLGGAAATYISRLLSKPIRNLAAYAEKIADGDLRQDEIIVKTKDEVADLAHAFNRMTLNLRQLIHQINASAEKVAASSEELLATTEQTTKATNHIASAIQEVASGAEIQVTSSKENSIAMEEVSAGILRIAESSATVSESAQEATRLSEQGNQSVQKAIKQMELIELRTRNTEKAIKQLHARSHEIGGIIGVITEIADQTNLLSLNAAIEAARAGHQGRGFAVVASEVRKLAEQSSNSAAQIVGLIKKVQSDTEAANREIDESTKEVILGKTVIHQTGEAFHQILHAVEEVNVQIQDVSATSEQISANTQEVAASVEQLAHIAREASEGSQNVAASSEEQLASMEEITASAEALSKLAQDLQALVTQFKV
jgi:methyl-accepting chemotaxis protein